MIAGAFGKNVQCLGDMDTEATQEDSQHESPLDVLKHAAEPAPLADAVTHCRQCNISEPVEDNDDGEPYFPTVDVVLVKVSVKPADGEVVGNGQNPRRADCVVGANVGDDSDLGGHANVGEQEFAEKRGERSDTASVTECGQLPLRKGRGVLTLSKANSVGAQRAARCSRKRISPIEPVRHTQ